MTLAQVALSRPYTVDPQVYAPFDERNTVFSRRRWDQDADFYGQNMYGHAPQAIAEGEPGYSRVEFARLRAAWTVASHFRGAYSWKKLGRIDPITELMGQHEVTDRAQMSALVVETARMYGADLVGMTTLDRRWVYANDRRGHTVDIPPKLQYAVVMAVAMDAAAIATSPAFLAASATGMGYSRMAFAASSLAEFIRNLGYHAIPMGNNVALSIPLAIDAGLGELGRNGLLITPEYGSCVRLCKVFTDLPLVPDRAASFGLADTCRTCRRCTDACEVDAIQSDPEPSYRIVSPSNNPGILRWAVDPDKCFSFWVENGASCSTCIAACPFTQRARKAS